MANDPLQAPEKHTPRASVELAPVARRVCVVLGVILVALGILGFVPGITSGYSTLVDQQPQATLAGVFQVSMLFNAINLVFGISAVVAARRGHTRHVLGLTGLVYVALWIYSFVPLPAAGAGIMALNPADVWLYFGVGFVAIGTLFLSFGQIARSVSRS